MDGEMGTTGIITVPIIQIIGIGIIIIVGEM